MKGMKTREKVQTKLNSMASILLDDIIVPGETNQQGSETLSASYYDNDGNKFTFVLGLTVTPNADEETGAEETALTIDEKLEMILSKISSLEEDVNLLKTYHTNAPAENEPSEEEGVENGEDN